VQIINGSIYLVGPVQNFQTRLRHSVSQLLALSRAYRLPDVDLVWSVSDYCKLHGDSLKDTSKEKCPRRVRLSAPSPSFLLRTSQLHTPPPPPPPTNRSATISGLDLM